MQVSAESMRVMYPLFQAGDGGSSPTSALQLQVERLEFERARVLNEMWHSRLPRFGVGFIQNMPFRSYAALYQNVIYAVGIWSNPCARNLPQDTWLELRRLAIAPDAPRYTASRMLAVMCRMLKREKPHVERFISYQDTEVHTGTIYKAAGWVATVLSDGAGGWDRPNRSRPKAQSEAPKLRWEKLA